MTSQNKIHTVQQLLLQIPHGRVTTYKELAKAMGTKGYRYIGQLLHQNPEPDRFPCYKVVKSDGSVGGFANGPSDKIRRLEANGIKVKKGRIADFSHRLFRYKKR